MANKIPAFQFYPADWRKDNGVQALNFFERGVWFEILCLMHESEDRGRLLLNGKKMPDEALARLLGLDKQVLSKTLATLLDFGVCTRDESGALVNRRMVKDEAERRANADRQRKFYDKNKPNAEPNGKPNGDLTEIQRKSNNASSSSSSTTEEKDKGGGSHSAREPAREEPSQPPPKFESLPEYLLRKQLEYPDRDVQKIHDEFVPLCGSDKYPKLKNTRRHFDKWLETQDVEFETATAKPDWKKAIEECDMCDDKGMRDEGGSRMVCRHQEEA